MRDYFYEHNGVRLKAVFDDELNGLVLCDGEGEFSEWYIPKAIDGIEIKDIAGEAMDFLHGYEKVIIDEDNEFFSVIDGVLFNSDRTVLICYPPEKHDESYDVPDGVKMIGDGAFGNQYLNRVTLPAGLEKIAQYAFACCRNLEEITIPKSLRKIYLKAFIGCDKLKAIPRKD